MKKKNVKNKNQARLNQMSEAASVTSISQAIKQLTGGSKAPVASLPLPAAAVVGEAPEPVAYKMRVECYDDGALLYEMLFPYVEYWEEKRESIHAKGQEFEGPGFAVRFGITPDTLTLLNLQSLFHCVPDCHFAEETVALEANFTGVRKAVAENQLTAPEMGLIGPMVQRVERAAHFLRLQLGRTERLGAMLKGVSSSGALPQMTRGGFISLMKHTPSGLSSILRISAASGTVDPVKERLILMQQ